MAVRRRNFTRRQLLALLLAAGSVLVAINLFQWLVLSPWAVPFGDRATLTGRWVGTVDYGPGSPHTVALDLGYEVYGQKCNSKTSCGDISGELRVCGPSGTKATRVTGDPNNRSGSSFWLIPLYGDDDSAGHYLHEAAGEWQGDRVTLRTRYHTMNADGSSVKRSEQQAQLTIELRRVTEAEHDRTCPV